MQLLAWTMWPADDRSRSEHEGKRSAQEWALATSRGAQGDAPVIVAALGLPQSPREHASRMNAYTNAQALESSYLSLSSSFMGASSMGYCSLNGQPNSLALNAASNRNGPNTLHFLGMQGDHGMGAQHYSNSATPIRSFLTQRKSSFNGVLPLPQPSFDAAPTEFSGQYVQPSESLQVNKAYLPVTAYEQDGATFPFLPQGRLHAAHQDETSRVPNVQNLKAPPSARATVPSEQPLQTSGGQQGTPTSFLAQARLHHANEETSRVPTALALKAPPRSRSSFPTSGELPVHTSSGKQHSAALPPYATKTEEEEPREPESLALKLAPKSRKRSADSQPRQPKRKDGQWLSTLEELKEYKAEHGDTIVPRGYSENPRLASWVAEQRKQYKLLQDKKQSSITSERIALLNGIDFAWNAQEAAWARRMSDLRLFQAENGHCLVPLNHDKFPKLGLWVKEQRRHYTLMKQGKPSHMTAGRCVELNSLGFCYDTHEATWMERWRELREYKEQYGSSVVPSSHHNTKLATWVHHQRRQYKRLQLGQACHISKERIRLLNQIGFVWYPRDASDAGADSSDEESDAGDELTEMCDSDDDGASPWNKKANQKKRARRI